MRSDPLVAAILEAKSAGAQALIHCGDLIGANTLRASLKLDIPIEEAMLELGGRRNSLPICRTMDRLSPAPVITMLAGQSRLGPRH